MVRFLVADNGSIRVEQNTKAPAVYLDHWALRNISANPCLRVRFSAALKSRGGTLMLSWLNLVEFVKVVDGAQARAAESLVEEVLPNIFFLEVNPFTVIERENELLAGGPPAPPHADTGFLKAFIALRPKSVMPFTANNLFTVVVENGSVARFDALADTIAERVEALRGAMDSDPEFEKRVRRLPSGPKIQHGTRYVLRELARTFLVDRGIKVTRNHAIDLVHSVVPLSYCDLVLLDKHWEAQVERVRLRFAEASMDLPLGRVYSGKMNGVDKFFSVLESSDI